MRREGSQPHTSLPSPEHQFQEEDFPQHLAVKISREPVQLRQRAAGSPGALLKGLSMVTHSQKLTLSTSKGTETQKSTRDVLGGTELSGFRGRAGGATLSRTEVLTDTIVPLSSPPSNTVSKHR